MNPEILNFITGNLIGVISVILADGKPYSAAVHYSYHDGKFFIDTSSATVKVQPFLHGEIGDAAFAIGFDRNEMVCVQMRGTVRVITDRAEVREVFSAHYQDHPKANQYAEDPQTVVMEFTPKWMRYSDLKSDPKTIVETVL